jgi:hypothetical protein
MLDSHHATFNAGRHRRNTWQITHARFWMVPLGGGASRCAARTIQSGAGLYRLASAFLAVSSNAASRTANTTIVVIALLVVMDASLRISADIPSNLRRRLVYARARAFIALISSNAEQPRRGWSILALIYLLRSNEAVTVVSAFIAIEPENAAEDGGA